MSSRLTRDEASISDFLNDQLLVLDMTSVGSESRIIAAYPLLEILDGLISTADIQADGCSTECEEAQKRAVGEQHDGC